MAKEVKEESTLMVVISHEYSEILVHGLDLWYLAPGARNHITSMRSLFNSLDNYEEEIVKLVMDLPLDVRENVKFI